MLIRLLNAQMMTK